MSRIIFICIICWCPWLAWPQEKLDLASVPPGNIFTIEFTLSDQAYKQIQRKMLSGVDIPVLSGRVGPAMVSVHSLHTRGKTSAGFRRKSYQVQLDSAVVITEQGISHTLQQFYLLNLALDRHYLHNYFALSCFDLLGISSLFKKYVEVRINGQTEGVYLLTQRPVDYAFKVKNAAVAIRRLNSGAIDNEKIADDTDPAFLKQCELRFKEINDLCKKLSGPALVQALDERLYLQEYFDWMAWNYWVRNGDYTDEVFYYADGHPIRFHLLPWDFDDILAVAPHEGQEQRDQLLGEQLIFSSEDILDRTIAKDATLYAQYLPRLKNLLTLFGEPGKLKTLLRQQYAALLPFYLQPEITAMSKYDQASTSRLQMEDQLKNMFQYLLRRAKSTLDQMP